MNEANIDKIPHSCVLQLRAVYGSLKSAEKKAADFLLNDPDSFSQMSIVNLASRAGCSEATIVRLSKKLGYEGFPELKKHIAAQSESDFDYNNITENDDPIAVVSKVFDSSVQGIQDTLAMLDKDAYRTAMQSFIRAGKFLFCGAGDAQIVAMEAHQKMLRLGRSAMYSSDSDTQLILASHLGPGDVCVAISYSGRTRSVVEVAKVVRATGAEVIAITNFPISPLAKRADHPLQTAAFSESTSGEIMSKRVTALCLIESLYINYIIGHDDGLLNALSQSARAVEVNKL